MLVGDIISELRAELCDSHGTWQREEYTAAVRDAYLELCLLDREFSYSEHTEIRRLKLRPGRLQDFRSQGIEAFVALGSQADGSCSDMPAETVEEADTPAERAIQRALDTDKLLSKYNTHSRCPVDPSTVSETSETGTILGDDGEFIFDRVFKVQGSRTAITVNPCVPNDGTEHWIEAIVYVKPEDPTEIQLINSEIPVKWLPYIRNRARATLFYKDTDEFTRERAVRLDERADAWFNRYLQMIITEEAATAGAAPAASAEA